MNYTNEQIRRQDRLLEKEKAISLLKNGEYGVLSMQDEENGAYGVPINYVWKQEKFHLHSLCSRRTKITLYQTLQHRFFLYYRKDSYHIQSIHN